MKQKDYRQTAGSFRYDDFDVYFRTTAGKELECAGVAVDFDGKKIVINQKKKG